jgi:ribulose-phosphate 3-epimerase
LNPPNCCDNFLWKKGKGKTRLARTIQIAPSILSADFAHLAREIEKAEAGGADVLHLDVMDGHFVPNITIGPPVVAWIRKCTSLPLDTHLMIENPSKYVDSFVSAGVTWLSVHVEADVHLNRTIHQIKQHGIRAGVALNPSTPICALEEVLPIVDFVLVMSVNPGFGGQSFIPSTLGKIARLREIILTQGYHASVEIDGGIGLENLKQVVDAGAEIIVSGSAVFAANREPGEIIRQMKEIAGQ